MFSLDGWKPDVAWNSVSKQIYKYCINLVSRGPEGLLKSLHFLFEVVRAWVEINLGFFTTPLSYMWKVIKEWICPSPSCCGLPLMKLFQKYPNYVWQLQDVFCYRRWTGDCKFHLYTSHPPCGDASIFFLNSRNKRHQIFICLHSYFTECVRKYSKLVFFTIFFLLFNFLSATALSHSEWQLHKFINFFLIIFLK